MKRILFSIIIFSLIKWSVVLPISIERENDEPIKDISLVKRECKDFKNFVGSNLFDGYRKNCFSPEDVNQLVARREFEMMIPKDLPQDLLDDRSISHILRYFYYGFWLLRRMDDCSSRRIMEKAFYDTLGGFLRYYLVPVSKFSFYASRAELKTVRNVMMLYQKCRVFLNTNGNGWRAPMSNPLMELRSVNIEPIVVDISNGGDENDKCCSDLDLTTASNGMEIVDDNMLVSLPKIELEDGDGFLSNIWLPFSRKRTYNLRSCKSAFIVLKFYRSVIRCYKVKSLSQKCFDQKFRQWIVENVKMHLGDEQFYPGLGGLLNIYETMRVGAKPADASDSKKDDDEENFAPQIEADSLNADERLAYGDRNLQDWLKGYDDGLLDFGGVKRKRSNKLKRKKYRKSAKLRRKPTCSPETMQLDELNKIITKTCNKKGTISNHSRPSISTDINPSTSTSKGTATCPSEIGKGTNINNDSTTETSTQTTTTGFKLNCDLGSKSSTDLGAKTNIDNGFQPGAYSTCKSSTNNGTKPSADTGPKTSPNRGSNSGAGSGLGVGPSKIITKITSTTARPAIVGSNTGGSEHRKRSSILRFLLFLILLLILLLLLIAIYILLRKLCNRSRIDSIVEYFKSCWKKTGEALPKKLPSLPPTPKLFSEPSKSSAKSVKSAKSSSKSSEKKSDKKKDDKAVKKGNKKSKKSGKKSGKKGKSSPKSKKTKKDQKKKESKTSSTASESSVSKPKKKFKKLNCGMSLNPKRRTKQKRLGKIQKRKTSRSMPRSRSSSKSSRSSSRSVSRSPSKKKK